MKKKEGQIPKIIYFLGKEENAELLKVFGQVFIFCLIVSLIFVFCLLIIFERLEIASMVYSICILCGLLIVLVISGDLEVKVGEWFNFNKKNEPATEKRNFGTPNIPYNGEVKFEPPPDYELEHKNDN